MVRSPLKVFVDADAFVALVKTDDQNHTKAKTIFGKLCGHNAHFLTSNYVFAEVVTVLSLRVGRQAAADFMDRIKSPQDEFPMVFVDKEIESKAIDIFKQQTSKNVSFMDCCHIACVRHFHLDGIFSFDHIYSQNKVPLAVDLV